MMKLKLLLILFALLPGLTAANSIQIEADVDRRNISIEETLQLTVRINQQVGGSGPDFSELAKNFDILSNQRSNQFRSYNGAVESWTEWTLMLAPNKEGKLLIPSFTYKNQFSDAIEVTVKKNQQNYSGQIRSIFVEAEVDKSTAYTQEQLLLSVRLVTAESVRNYEMDDLQLSGAIITELEPQRFQRRIQGRTYVVVEQQFAIHPQSSGEIIIPALTYQVVIAPSNNSMFFDPFGSNNRGQIRRLTTQPIQLTIKPKPQSFANRDWLPAKKVTLTQSWSDKLSNFKVGEPITRILTLNADGLTSAQLPPLPELKDDVLKAYPDQPQTQDTKSVEGVSGSRIETVALVPTKAGDITLPAITVPWWDTVNQVERQVTLPEQKIHVQAAKFAQTKHTDQKTPVVSGEPVLAENNPQAFKLWQWLSALNFVFALVFFGLWWNLRRSKKNLPRNTGSSEASPSEKTAYRQLLRACKNNDAIDIRQHLQHWLLEFIDDKSKISLHDAGEYFQNPLFDQQVKLLEKALYSRNGESAFDGLALLKSIDQIRQSKHSTETHEHILKPLYSTR